MRIITDLQIHSKYARAVSPEMVIPKIWQWAKIKGIGLVATGDWTHPLWMREIKANLEETGNGLLRIRDQKSEIENKEGPYFLLATEVSSIYSQGGKLRRIHTLIWVSKIETAEKINKELIKHGCNLIADGRPIIGLTSIQVAELVFSIDPTALIIPAHAWTPWFSLYGSESGFDSIDECFGNFAKYIYAIETGLSSDPAMNWRIKELDNRSIVSFSDAHSGPKLGREATVFELSELSYENIRRAIMGKWEVESGKWDTEVRGENSRNQKITPQNHTSHISPHISYTIEFYPEEGKYHYTGHRNCGVKQTPAETKRKGTVCPVCGRKLTVGVMHRVEQLASRTEDELGITYKQLHGTQIKGIFSEAFSNRPPFVKLVPLQEILSEIIGGIPTSQKIQNEYKKLVDSAGGEFNILLNTPTGEITKLSGVKVAEAIQKVRIGDIYIDPGYDGVFGKVKIWGEKKKQEETGQKEQMSLF